MLNEPFPLFSGPQTHADSQTQTCSALSTCAAQRSGPSTHVATRRFRMIRVYFCWTVPCWTCGFHSLHPSLLIFCCFSSSPGRVTFLWLPAVLRWACLPRRTPQANRKAHLWTSPSLISIGVGCVRGCVLLASKHLRAQACHCHIQFYGPPGVSCVVITPALIIDGITTK